LRSRLKLRLAGPLPTVLQAGEGRVGEQGSSEAPSSDSSGTVCSRASVGACAQRLVNVSATALFLQTAKRRREDERLDPVSMKLIHHLPVTRELDPRVPLPSDKASYEERWIAGTSLVKPGNDVGGCHRNSLSSARDL